MRAIVKDLELFSRSDGERREAVDLHAVIDSSASMARNEIKHRARLVRAYGDVPAEGIGRIFDPFFTTRPFDVRDLRAAVVGRIR